jgi:hypothetical protein
VKTSNPTEITVGWAVARMGNEKFILIFCSGTYYKTATWKTIKRIILRLILRVENGRYWLSGGL